MGEKYQQGYLDVGKNRLYVELSYLRKKRNKCYGKILCDRCANQVNEIEVFEAY